MKSRKRTLLKLVENRKFRDAISQACGQMDVSFETVKSVLLQAIEQYEDKSPRAIPRALPVTAPELYVSRGMSASGNRETIVEFLERVWDPWIKAKLLTRADLKHLDAKADKAIDNWIQNGHKYPEHLKLPTKKEANDIAIAADPMRALSDPRLARVIASRHYKGIPIPGLT